MYKRDELWDAWTGQLGYALGTSPIPKVIFGKSGNRVCWGEEKESGLHLGILRESGLWLEREAGIIQPLQDWGPWKFYLSLRWREGVYMCACVHVCVRVETDGADREKCIEKGARHHPRWPLWAHYKPSATYQSLSHSKEKMRGAHMSELDRQDSSLCIQSWVSDKTLGTRCGPKSDWSQSPDCANEEKVSGGPRVLSELIKWATDLQLEDESLISLAHVFLFCSKKLFDFSMMWYLAWDTASYHICKCTILVAYRQDVVWPSWEPIHLEKEEVTQYAITRMRRGHSKWDVLD